MAFASKSDSVSARIEDGRRRARASVAREGKRESQSALQAERDYAHRPRRRSRSPAVSHQAPSGRVPEDHAVLSCALGDLVGGRAGAGKARWNTRFTEELLEARR